MRNRDRVRAGVRGRAAPFVVVLMFASLWVLLAGCTAKTETKTGPTNAFLVKGQVIVTGPGDDVDKVIIQAAKQSDVTLRALPAGELPLGSLIKEAGDAGQRTADQTEPDQFFPFSPDELQTLVVRPYAFDQDGDSPTVGEVVAMIDKAAAAMATTSGKPVHVYADPNYLTGILGQSQCSNPFTPGGSPFTPGGSSFEVAGNRFTPGGSGSGGSPTVAAAGVDFWGQWAFEQIGVGQPQQQPTQQAAGAVVYVGVFDTSPFTLTVPPAITDANGVTHATEVVDWVTPALSLGVSHLAALSPALPATDPQKAMDMRDHGLFVSGLIHAVAPQSNITLIRVLNPYGCGSLQALNMGLFHYIAQSQIQGTLASSVLNMSLGIHKPKASDRDRAEELRMSPGEIDRLRMDEIESLRTLLYFAHSQGAVIVAAAGNESTKSQVEPMQIPADYPFVVGVAANNKGGARSCFSNRGDVAAPGGDGGADATEPAKYPCAPRNDVCTDSSCDKSVVSLVHHVTDGYAYWSGTSFSAPLVSGLAALLLSTGDVSPLNVPGRLASGACPPVPADLALGAGITNVQATLSGAACPAP